MSELWVIFALIFVAASLAIYGVYWIFVFNRREHKTINRRLDLAKRLDDSAVVLQTLLRERGFRNETNPVLRQFGDWLTQTGVPVERRSLVSGVHGALRGMDIDLQSDARHRADIACAGRCGGGRRHDFVPCSETQPTYFCFY